MILYFYGLPRAVTVNINANPSIAMNFLLFLIYDSEVRTNKLSASLMCFES